MLTTPTKLRTWISGVRIGRQVGAALLLGLLAQATPMLLPGARAAGIGDPAPDFIAENILDTAPDVIQLSQYRGQIVVLSFFAYW